MDSELKANAIRLWARFFDLPLLRTVVSYGVFPNALFLLAGHFFYFMRPVVNVDYLLAGALAPFLWGWLGAVLFSLVFLNDIFVNLAPVYHFEVFEAFRWFSSFFYIRSFFSIGIVASVIAVCGIAGVGATRWARGPGLRWRAFVTMAFLATAFSAADICNGTSFLALPASVSWINFNIAYSGLRRSVMAMDALAGAQTHLVFQPLSRKGSATGDLFEEFATPSKAFAPKQIALILVESWGWSEDAELREALMEKFRSLALRDRYEISFREIPFEGHTIQGEFRELCGVKLLSFGEEGIPKCLPSILQEKAMKPSLFMGSPVNFIIVTDGTPGSVLKNLSLLRNSRAPAFEKDAGPLSKGFVTPRLSNGFIRSCFLGRRPNLKWSIG